MKSTLTAWVVGVLLSSVISVKDISELKEWDAIVVHPDGTVEVIDCTKNTVDAICTYTGTDEAFNLEE